MNKLFLARHGRAENDALTPSGMADACSIADQLCAEDLDNRLVIVTSTANRAQETTAIIRSTVGRAIVIRSVYMALGGLRPMVVDSLHEYTERIVDASVKISGDYSVLAVAHAPLVKAVTGQRPEYGTPYPVSAEWRNLGYDPQIADMILSLPADEVEGMLY